MTQSRVTPARMLPWSGGRHQLAADLEHQVHRAHFLEPLVLGGVEPEHLGVAGLARVLGGEQAGGVVGARLDRPEPALRRAHEAPFDPDLHRLHARLVIGADRRGDDEYV
jgi:hypothetical protein